jgi:hypothetical protein
VAIILDHKEETLRDSSLTELDFTQDYSRSKQNWYVITKKEKTQSGYSNLTLFQLLVSSGATLFSNSI